VTIFIGCSNKDEEDAERISVMEEKIDALFNQEKTDLAENVETKQFDEINELLEAEEGEDFSEENALRIDSVILYLNEAVNMHKFQEQIFELVSEDGVIDEKAYLEAKEQVVEFKEKEVFYERQLAELEKVEELYEQQFAQQEHVEKTEQAMAKLFNKENKVKDDVTKKEYDKVAKLIKGIEDEDVKEALNKDLKKVDKKLKAIAKAEKEAEEKRIAEEKRLAEEKKKEEKRQLAEQQKKQQAQANNKSNNQQSSQSETKQSTASKSKESKKSNSSDQGNNSKENDEEPLYGGMTGQEIADWINNGDCVKTGEGYIGGGDYNTWESFSCK